MSVFFYGCITLDGYLADKNHELDWLYQSGSPEETDYESFYKEMDITIMGRRTLRELEKAADPGTVYPTTTNYVFTHDQDLTVPCFIPVSRNVVDFVREQDPALNIWVVGGTTLLAPLLDQDLIDTLIIQIAPVLLGNGIPLFSQNEGLKRFQLVEVRKYGQFAEITCRRLNAKD